MQVRKLTEYVKEKPSNEPEGNVIISTDDEDVTKPLLSALAILEKNKSRHEAVKFIYKGQEIGNISKESIVDFIVDSYAFETPGDSYTLYYKCPVCNAIRTVTGGRSYVPKCKIDNVDMIRG